MFDEDLDQEETSFACDRLSDDVLQEEYNEWLEQASDEEIEKMANKAAEALIRRFPELGGNDDRSPGGVSDEDPPPYPSGNSDTDEEHQEEDPPAEALDDDEWIASITGHFSLTDTLASDLRQAFPGLSEEDLKKYLDGL